MVGVHAQGSNLITINKTEREYLAREDILLVSSSRIVR
jgi:hypothetical protein